MKSLFLAALLLSVSCHKTPPAPTITAPTTYSDWFVVSATNPSLVEVTVERALYERGDQPHFFLHFWVRNLRNKPAAIDLRDKWRVLHPNQWGFSETNYRQAIDESRMTKPPRDEASEQDLLKALANNQLQLLEPKGALDFYVEFNASGRKDIEAQAQGLPFFIVSMDGELQATDGHLIELHSLIEDFDPGHTDLVLAAPVRWRTLPAQALLVLR